MGRTVAGLLADDPLFAILPPWFPAMTPLLSHALSICFPDAPANLAEVLEMALASVVYHRGWLRSVSPSHPVFKTALFLEQGLADGLGAQVQCRLGSQADRIRATGIPPSVKLLGRLQVRLLCFLYSSDFRSISSRPSQDCPSRCRSSR